MGTEAGAGAEDGAGAEEVAGAGMGADKGAAALGLGWGKYKLPFCPQATSHKASAAIQPRPKIVFFIRKL